MSNQLQKDFFEAFSNIHFTSFQTVFLILVASVMMGFSVLWISPLFTKVFIAISDQKITATGVITQMFISETARPGVNKTPDKKAHVYPFQVSLLIKADNKNFITYPIGEDKYLEFLQDAIKFTDSISTNIPLKMEFRTSTYIDTTTINNIFFTLNNRNGAEKAIEFTYYRNHPQYNNLTKIIIRWGATSFTLLFSSIILFALFIAVNYSLNQKIIFSIIIMILAIFASIGYKKIDVFLENYALNKNPVKLVIDVDQHYNAEKTFNKVSEFVSTESGKE